MTFAVVVAAAWTLTGFPGPMPPVIVDATVCAAYAQEQDGTVHVSSRLYADATGDRQARVDAAATLIHEFAHTRQTPGLAGWQQEGGAEAFARDKDWQLRKRFGVLPERWAYRPEVRRVLAVFGVWWVRHGQFRSVA